MLKRESEKKLKMGGRGVVMREYCIFPVSRSNQITEEYYMFLVGQINRRTCSKKVCRVLRENGTHKYFTYHLISTL